MPSFQSGLSVPRTINDREGQDPARGLSQKIPSHLRIGRSQQSSKPTMVQFKISTSVGFPSDNFGSKNDQCQKQISLKTEV